jgi:large subunit ribosomal protein L28
LAKQRQLEAGKDQTTEVTDKKEEVSATAAAV